MRREMEAAREDHISDEDLAQVDEMGKKKTEIISEIKKVIVGQDKVIEEILIALFCRGHCLLVGVPGLAKTLLISTLAGIMELEFNRVQFTPDLMPSDITGTGILEEEAGSHRRSFRFLKGPLFTNILLADEINRTPPKTQSALLQAMQEYKVTAGGVTYPLDLPFFVLATQNPIEQEGTYPLPEAQLDRFMLKLKIDYPNKDEERQILDRMAATNIRFDINAVISPEDISQVRNVVDEIYIDEKIKDYIVDSVCATREPDKYGIKMANFINYGASPRATIYLTVAAKAHAFLQQRGYVTPQDVKSIGPDVLRHRVIVSYEAEAEDKTSEDIIKTIFDSIEVP